MSRRVARALHSPDGALAFGEVGEGQYVKRDGSKMVGVDAPSGGGAAWGEVTGTLSNQTDLQTALDGKSGTAHTHSYVDLTDKPTLGDSASKNVGTTAGTVAAGDHTHAGGGAALDAWPVGSVFIAVVSTSPATLLGGGTWSAFGAGRMLVGLNGADADFDTVEETGGVKTVTLTGAQSGIAQHTHTQNAHTHVQDAHSHTYSSQTATTGSISSYEHGAIDTSSAANESSISTNAATAVNQNATAVNQNAGPTDAAEAHSNMPPYIVVYMWKRTA